MEDDKIDNTSDCEEEDEKLSKDDHNSAFEIQKSQISSINPVNDTKNSNKNINHQIKKPPLAGRHTAKDAKLINKLENLKKKFNDLQYKLVKVQKENTQLKINKDKITKEGKYILKFSYGGK